ncbi:MAG: SRPBCC family protein [Acidobacteria bacterium]|nr:SRPBCC family protein [Acidobacteriota bacterium]
MKGSQILMGLGLGAGLMYMLDPNRGKRRRAQVRDKVVYTLNVADKAIGKASRDLNNRLAGLEAEVKSIFRSEDVDDDVLKARVQTRLGRLVSHPHAIKVECKEGKVTLSGHVLAHEVDALLHGVFSVDGVTEVLEKLEAHAQAGNIPDLQGGRERNRRRFELMQSNWAPGPRLLAGTAGGALALYGARRHDILGRALEIAGLALFSRGLTNLEMRDLIGLSGGPGIGIQKAINVNAPIEKVYEVWNRHEDFPHFMSRVLEVKKLGDGRYHWKVAGPAGIPVEWEAVITKQTPNEMLAWESVEGSMIEQKGIVRFQANGSGGTRVEVKMSYHPPAGAAGHALAKLFGADPKSEMTADLMRMKSFIETGHQPHDAAERVTQKAHAH